MTGPLRPRGPRRPARPKGLEDVPELTPEEVERRVTGREEVGSAIVVGDYIGGLEAKETDAVGAGEPADAATVAFAPAVVQPTPPSRGRPESVLDPTADRRRILWRDSATILIGVIVALLAYQTFAPGGAGGPTSSETPIPSTVTIGTLPPPASLPPGVTFGPIIDPSLGVDATPTPIPVITLGPSPSPSPSPEPSPSPTRKPTPKPSRTPPPTTAPPPTIDPPPTIEPPPPSDPPTPDPPSDSPSSDSPG